jgi:predicted dehydrogenase
MAPVGLGFIGYGIMGERLLRAAAAHDAATLHVSAVWDPSPAATARAQRDFPDLPRAASSEALIEASDCVYIASPPASHLEHARRALSRGRAVLCEKPLATDLDDAAAFVAETERAAARVGVNFPFASSFAVDQLKAWIADGSVGEPRALRIEAGFATWPRAWQSDAASWLDRRAEGGFTREVVSHFLFLSRRLLGPLELRRSSVDYPDGGASERAIEAVLLAGETPVRISGQVGRTERDEENSWLLEGSAGAIRIRDWSIAEQLRDGLWTAAPEALPNEKIRRLVLRRQLDKVAAMTRGSPHDLATPREAFEVQGVVEAILRGDGGGEG